MNREDIAKLIEEHADIGKGEAISLAVGLIVTVVGLVKEGKERKDRMMLAILLGVVIVQSLLLICIVVFVL